VDADAMAAHVADNFDGVIELRADGDRFFVYDPRDEIPEHRRFPFATIVTGDRYDTVSHLDRPSVYRLNIGLPKSTYTARFGAPPTERDGGDFPEPTVDYAALDEVMPHPVYGSQYWVCVLNPGESTLDTAKELLAEAHAFAARKHENRHARRDAGAS
jgi:hypothetical protein